MILLDVNVLIYAYNDLSPDHARAKAWLEKSFSGPEFVCLPWATLLAFVRITTDHRILKQPLTTEEAIGIVEEWLELPTVRLVEPGERHWSILRRLLVLGQARGGLVPDAHLAALAIEHGAELCSTDRDFARFPDLRWRNPIEAPWKTADEVHEPRSTYSASE